MLVLPLSLNISLVNFNSICFWIYVIVELEYKVGGINYTIKGGRSDGSLFQQLQGSIQW